MKPLSPLPFSSLILLLAFLLSHHCLSPHIKKKFLEEISNYHCPRLGEKTLILASRIRTMDSTQGCRSYQRLPWGP